MKIEILKIADVHTTSISQETNIFLVNDCTETYRDMVMNENIYNISDILENDNVEPTENVKTELEKINKAIGKRGCAYLRIVFAVAIILCVTTSGCYTSGYGCKGNSRCMTRVR